MSSFEGPEKRGQFRFDDGRFVVLEPSETGGLFVARYENQGGEDQVDIIRNNDVRESRLLGEIESSISFVNVEFVVCTALLLFNFKALSAAPIAIISLFAAMVFLLYGGLCFAVAGGEIARGSGSLDRVCRSLEWGNILTEWFGMYLMILALPIVIQTATNESYLGGIALGIDVAGYSVYVATRNDLLGRFIGGWFRFVMHGFFILGIVVNWIGVAAQAPLVTWGGGLAFISMSTICAVIHASRGEFKYASGRIND